MGLASHYQIPSYFIWLLGMLLHSTVAKCSRHWDWQTKQHSPHLGYAELHQSVYTPFDFREV